MNEVKYICDRMLAAPAPPLPDSADMLAAARRSAHRRDSLRALGGVAATAAVIAAAAALGTPGLDRQPAPPTPAAAPDRNNAVPPPAAPQQQRVPVAHAAARHSDRMDQLLLAAVPPGYTTTLHPHRSDDPDTVYPNARTPRTAGAVVIPASASIALSAEGAEGWLHAEIRNDGRPVPSGDLCAAGVTGPDRPVDTCRVVVVAGVSVQVLTWREAAGQVVTATRFLRDGRLTVSAHQAMIGGGGDAERPLDIAGSPGTRAHRPPLAAPPLGPEQVAALAANPAMLQFP